MLHSQHVYFEEISALPRRICQLWLDIQDIVGPVRKWPPKMRNMFFKKHLTHYEHLKVCAFVYVNSLNPEMFFEWSEHFELFKDEEAQCECKAWFKELKLLFGSGVRYTSLMCTTTGTNLLTDR